MNEQVPMRLEDAIPKPNESIAELSQQAVQEERLRRIATAQNQEPWIKEIKEYLMGNVDSVPRVKMKQLAKLAEDFVMDRSQVLYYFPHHVMVQGGELRLVAPQSMINDILRIYHDEMGRTSRSNEDL